MYKNTNLLIKIEKGIEIKLKVFIIINIIKSILGFIHGLLIDMEGLR